MSKYIKYNYDSKKGMFTPEIDSIRGGYPYNNVSAHIYLASTSANASFCTIPSGFRMNLKYIYCYTDSGETNSVYCKLYDGGGTSQPLIMIAAPSVGQWKQENIKAMWVQSYIHYVYCYGTETHIRVGGILVCSEG